MKGYIATYNFKCRDLTYVVGKTYQISDMEIFSHGFHFCKNAQDTLGYYSYNKDFVLLEIEAIGKISTIGDTSVTDEIKIVRVIPPDEYEYLTLLGIQLDERGNRIYQKNSDGSECVWEYDSNNNKIYEKHSDGSEYKWEYDSNNNKISQKSLYGTNCSWVYDSNSHVVGYQDDRGKSWTITIK